MLVLVYSARKAINPKLTYDYLAAKCRVSDGLVSMWFSGKRSPSEKAARILAKELACELDLIWAKAGTMEEAMEMALEGAEQSIGKTRQLSESPAPASRAPAEPDYSAAEANKLRVIRSITCEDEDAVTRAIAPLRLAASPPEQLDPSDEGSVTIPAAESEVRNAPIFPVRVFGTSMNNVVDPGDIVFYRRSRQPAKNAIVIARTHGGITMKRLRGKKLYPDSTDEHETIDPLDDDGLIGEVVAIHKPQR